jgi:hypothetical protein
VKLFTPDAACTWLLTESRSQGPGHRLRPVRSPHMRPWSSAPSASWRWNPCAGGSVPMAMVSGRAGESASRSTPIRPDTTGGWPLSA